MRRRVAAGVGFAALLFLLVQLGALALVPTFYESGYQTVEDPSDPTNSLVYIVAILVATAAMLAAFKFDLDWVVRAFVVLAAASISWYVFSVLLPPLAAIGASILLAALLVIHPEWYVIDAAGVLMGAGAAGLFGISFGLLPAILLLSVLAVYDAISVYGTEHMLDLASGVMDLKLPVVLVVPTTLSYSLLDDDPETDHDDDEDGQADDSEPEADDSEADDDRDVFFIGLGDAVIPGVLVASAAFFSPAPQFAVPIIELNLPALLALLGTLGGLLVLMRMVMKGRAHAGLPLLNGGAIGGYLLGSLVAGVSLLETVGLTGIV